MSRPVPVAAEMLPIFVAIYVQPSAVCQCLADFLMWVTDDLVIQFPVLLCLVGQVLGFAGNGNDLSACCTDGVQQSVMLIAS